MVQKNHCRERERMLQRKGTGREGEGRERKRKIEQRRQNVDKRFIWVEDMEESFVLFF